MADIKNPERRGFESSGQEPGQAGHLAEQAKEKASQAAEQARSAAASVRDRLSEQTRQAADRGKQRAATAIADIATAIREAGHKLHEEEQQGPANYVDRTADQVDSIADYLESHDVDDMIRLAEDTVRRQPALFLGLAFVSGLVVARFLRSSAHHQHSGSGQSRSWQGSSQLNYPGSETETTGEYYNAAPPARMEDVQEDIQLQTPPEAASDLGSEAYRSEQTEPPEAPEAGGERS